MTKITIDDLVASGEGISGSTFDDLLEKFIGEQPEILEYIEERCEDDDITTKF